MNWHKVHTSLTQVVTYKIRQKWDWPAVESLVSLAVLKENMNLNSESISAATLMSKKFQEEEEATEWWENNKKNTQWTGGVLRREEWACLLINRKKNSYSIWLTVYNCNFFTSLRWKPKLGWATLSNRNNRIWTWYSDLIQFFRSENAIPPDQLHIYC